MFKAARKLGEKLVVIINNDNWLHDKKGYVFMPEKERFELISSFPFVDKVILTDHAKKDSDRSVCRSLWKLRPSVFANGGDRKSTGDIPEAKLCEELGIKMAFNVGRGGKVQSSSWVVRDASRAFARSVRPWGAFYNWDNNSTWHLKTIYVEPGKRLSLQYHHHRGEQWTLVEGEATATIQEKKGKARRIALKVGVPFLVKKGTIHRLESKKGGVVVEISFGSFDENDIVRLEDDHGRIPSI